MKNIAIYGAGGFGREVACLIHKINEQTPMWKLIGFFDDTSFLKGEQISHYGFCIGGMEELNTWEKSLSVVIAIGTPTAIATIAKEIQNPNIDFPNIIHPNFNIDDPETFQIGKGNIIQGGCSVSCDVSIGDFNLVNASVVFGHDVKTGNYNTFMPNVRISGEVNIGDRNFFGVGSIILQQIKIGNKIRLGAGSVLMTQPKDGNLYIGNPAKKTVF